jgi:hypothetical protein
MSSTTPSNRPSKPVHWVSMQRWMNLTIEEHRRLDAYCRDMGTELGIDLVGDRVPGLREQIEFQKDRDEYIEEMSLGGERYDPTQMGPQTSVGKKS